MRIKIKTRKVEVEMELPPPTSSFEKHVEGLLVALRTIVEEINKIQE